MDVGKRIRQFRASRCMTIAQLADAAGISQGMLSEIERDLKNPTIRVLSQVAQGLGCLVTDLLDETPTGSRVEHTKPGERLVMEDPSNGMSRETISNFLHSRGVEFVRFILPPGCDTGVIEPVAKGIAKVGYVVRGTVYVTLGENTYALHERETFSFIADQPFKVENRSDTEAECIGLSSLPNGEVADQMMF